MVTPPLYLVYKSAVCVNPLVIQLSECNGEISVYLVFYGVSRAHLRTTGVASPLCTSCDSYPARRFSAGRPKEKILMICLKIALVHMMVSQDLLSGAM